mgnify:CR=1 FL=1
MSVKVPPELKEKVKKLGIKPSKLMRKAIEEEVRRREVEKIKEEIEMMRPILSKISIEEVVKSIKEDRERR